MYSDTDTNTDTQTAKALTSLGEKSSPQGLSEYLASTINPQPIFLAENNPLLNPWNREQIRQRVNGALSESHTFDLLPAGDRCRLINKAVSDALEIQAANGQEFLVEWWKRVERPLATAYWLDGGRRPKNVYSVWAGIRGKASDKVKVGSEAVKVQVKTRGEW